VAISVIVTIDAMLNPKARWRRLRSGAGSLQSIIWKYRTRTGPFELDERHRDSNRPEEALCVSLTEWRDNLMAGAGLKNTNMEQNYPAWVFKHFQERGDLDSEGSNSDVCTVSPPDDFHSPTQPARYIMLRVQPMMAFYARRVPMYNKYGLFLKVMILLFGIGGSCFAHYGKFTSVTAMTATATVLTSWSEFSDASSKVERYSSAIGALKTLMFWWDSLGDVQKASRESVNTLVERAEAIISEERCSWTSIASEQGEGSDGDKGTKQAWVSEGT